MTPLQIARRQYNVAEKRHAAAQICGRYDMSPRQTRRMYLAAENLRKWGGILARAEADAQRERFVGMEARTKAFYGGAR